MTRLAKHLFLAVLTASFCLGVNANLAAASQDAGQTPPAPTAAPATSDKPHGPMPVELTKSLDSKKLKEGDPVVAKITAELHTKDGGTIPRGSTLTGHVTEAKARSKGDPQAALGIVFDKITTPDGKTMGVKGVLQAVGPSLHSSEPAPSGGAIGPGMMAGHEGTGTGTTPPPTPGMSPAPQTSAPVLNGQSKGVVGIRGLELGENSVLLTGGKEVRLDSGTQMIVLVEFE
jgi:hypothetical protein